MSSVSISSGNMKLGQIPSVSLPSIATCRECKCREKCYASKLERLRPTVREAYQRNLTILNNEPETYWREVEGAIMLSRYFRFHVSGDIPNLPYFVNMVNIAERNQHCEILCFTKKFGLVNLLVARLHERGSELPKNLHVIFSGWKGLEMDNPYHLPEAHVLFRDGTTTARPDAKPCGGNCTDCALTDCGCWTLKPGEQIVFKEH